MALEQCCYPFEAYVCSYIKYRDHLIDSAEDVGLLVRKGIILHWLGDDAAVSNMINNFCKSIGNNYTCFGDISQEINAHYESRFNHMKATLKLIHFPNIWRGTATVAAADPHFHTDYKFIKIVIMILSSLVSLLLRNNGLDCSEPIKLW